MSQLINIFLEPGKVFAELKEKPTFIVPFILISVAMSVLFLMYFSKVDSAWFTDFAISASGREMSAAEISQMKNMMPSAEKIGYFYAAVMPIGMAIIFLVVSLYYFIAGKVSGSAVGFKQAISLATWTSMPLLLGTIVALVGVIMMSPQTALDSLMLTHIDPLIVQLPLDSRWKTLAKSLDLLSIWCIFLVALGWKTWGKTSWIEAITVAVIPSIVIYGAMVLWALVVG